MATPRDPRPEFTNWRPLAFGLALIAIFVIYGIAGDWQPANPAWRLFRSTNLCDTRVLERVDSADRRYSAVIVEATCWASVSEKRLLIVDTAQDSGTYSNRTEAVFEIPAYYDLRVVWNEHQVRVSSGVPLSRIHKQLPRWREVVVDYSALGGWDPISI